MTHSVSFMLTLSLEFILVSPEKFESADQVFGRVVLDWNLFHVIPKIALGYMYSWEEF